MVFVWPDNLKVMGVYPSPGNSCRLLGETPATSPFLDHDATLIGCPSESDARAIPGTIVGKVRGIALVSIPNDKVLPIEGVDAKVEGTGFDATAAIPCSGFGNVKSCDAGVQRGSERITVHVTLPNGALRTLIFSPKGQFITAGTARADGSADYKISSSRVDDWTNVDVGPEHYRVPDAFIFGD
jgi:hypothetical protein